MPAEKEHTAISGQWSMVSLRIEKRNLYLIYDEFLNVDLSRLS